MQMQNRKSSVLLKHSAVCIGNNAHTRYMFLGVILYRQFWTGDRLVTEQTDKAKCPHLSTCEIP